MNMLKFILREAHREALRELHFWGIYSLDSVPVHYLPFSSDSYCLGYEKEDEVEIFVNGLRLFEALISRSSEEEMPEFIIHELGHAFLFRLWNGPLSEEDRAEFIRIFGDYHSDGEGYKHRISDTIRGILGLKPRPYDETRFVSLYATTSPHEDWAESFAYYICGELLPIEKLNYIRKIISKYEIQSK